MALYYSLRFLLGALLAVLIESQTYIIDRGELMPMGITYDQDTSLYYFGSLTEGSLFTLDPATNTTALFVSDPALISSVSVHVTNRWGVCTTVVNNTQIHKFPDDPPYSKFMCFDQHTKEKVLDVDLTLVRSAEPELCFWANDFTSDREEVNFYITNACGSLWRLHVPTRSVSEFARHPDWHFVDENGKVLIGPSGATYSVGDSDNLVDDSVNLGMRHSRPSFYNDKNTLWKVPISSPNKPFIVTMTENIGGINGMMSRPNGILVAVTPDTNQIWFLKTFDFSESFHVTHNYTSPMANLSLSVAAITYVNGNSPTFVLETNTDGTNTKYAVHEVQPTTKELPNDALWPSECFGNSNECCPTQSIGWAAGRLIPAGKCGIDAGRGNCSVYEIPEGANRPSSLPFTMYCRCTGNFTGEACDRCKPGFTGKNCETEIQERPLRSSFGEKSPKHAIKLIQCMQKAKRTPCVNVKICDQRDYLSAYDFFVLTHSASIIADVVDYAHGVPSFAGWHAFMIERFEQMLRDVCDDNTLSLIRWHWSGTDPTYNLAFVNFLGGVTPPGPNVKNVTSGDPNLGFNSAPEIPEGGPFSWFPQIDHLGNKLNQRISRILGDFPPLKVLPYDESNLLFLIHQVNQWDIYPYNNESPMLKSARQVIEGFWHQIRKDARSSHNYWHLWFGGTMIYVKTSPGEPGWYFHHAMVDYWFQYWKTRHPEADYISDTPDKPAPPGAGSNDWMSPFMPPITAREGFHHETWSQYTDIESKKYTLNFTNFFQNLVDQHSDVAKLYQIGTTAKGKPIMVLRLAKGNPNSTVLFTAGVHSNDISAKEAAVQIASLLVQTPKRQNILAKHSIYIVYDVNPDGTEIVWNSDWTQRKNLNGVDINRNFPFGFDSECSGSNVSSAPDFKGNFSESEPETRVIMSLLQQIKPVLHVDFQAGGRTIRLPYGKCTPLVPKLHDYLFNLTSTILPSNYTISDSCCNGNLISQSHSMFGTFSLLLELGDEPQPSGDKNMEQIIEILPFIFGFFELQAPIGVKIVDGSSGNSIGNAKVTLIKDLRNNFTAEKWEVGGAGDGTLQLWVPSGNFAVYVEADGYEAREVTIEVQETGSTIVKVITLEKSVNLILIVGLSVGGVGILGILIGVGICFKQKPGKKHYDQIGS